MDIKQLTYFTTVAKAGSFSKAALLLHISQPSLSNAIANLEREIGSSLFERSTRHVRLTDTGILLFDRATDLIHQFSVIHVELQDVIHGNEIKIVFGLIESAHRWFSKVMQMHRLHYPEIQFSIIETIYNKNVVKALENYDIHAAISNHRIAGKDIVCKELYSERFVAVLPVDHELATHKTISLQDVAPYPLITGVQHSETWRQTVEAFEKEGLTPQIDYEIERFEMAKMLVQSRAGISILPEQYVENHLPDNLLYKTLSDTSLSRPIYLIYLKNRHFPQSITDLFSTIESYTHRKFHLLE